MAYDTPITIAEVIRGISANKYVLPSIQREFVWSSEQIETLFDSLMQDYPIGAFLFWEIDKSKINEFNFYEFLKNYHELKSTHNSKANLRGEEGVIAVLDGQQRLTSLYIGLKGTYAYRLAYKRKEKSESYPTRKLYLNLIEPPKEGSNNYNFKFKVTDEVSNSENEYWFEVGKILEMKAGDVTQYIIDNLVFSGYTQKQMKFASNTLSHLHKVIHTSLIISAYKERSNELDKVLNIFIRVNSGGTKLSYSDLLLSIATAQWENFNAREEINEFVDEINDTGDGFSFDKDFILKTSLVLSDLHNIAFKVDNFNKETMTKIEKNWDTLKCAIKQAISLVSHFGFSGETLTSKNAVIPIAYYLMRIGLPNNFIESSKTIENRSIIKKWLIRSLLKGTFGGQSDNVLRGLREVIKSSNSNLFPLDEIITKFKGTNKSITFTDDDIDEVLLNLEYGQKNTLLTLMILYPSLDYNNKFHIDHIYPKSKFKKTFLKKEGIADPDEYISLVNNIANLQLLPALVNEEKQNCNFDKWFNKHFPKEKEKIQYRTINLLPNIEYSYSNFLEFLDLRAEIIKKNLSNYLL